MKKLFAVALMAVVVLPAYAATAFFTGRQVQVQTVTYQMGWNCEYNYAGRTFWRVYTGTCPTSIEVQ